MRIQDRFSNYINMIFRYRRSRAFATRDRSIWRVSTELSGHRPDNPIIPGLPPRPEAFSIRFAAAFIDSRAARGELAGGTIARCAQA
jgi:hypothetical protein